MLTLRLIKRQILLCIATSLLRWTGGSGFRRYRTIALCRRTRLLASLLRAILIAPLIAVLVLVAVLVSPTATVLIIVLVGVIGVLRLVALSPIGITTLIVARWLTPLSVASLCTRLSLTRLPTFLVATSLIVAITLSTAAIAIDQATHLIGVFHANQIAIRRKAVIDIEVIAIAEVFVFVFHFGSWLGQGPITDVVHLLGQFTRGLERPIAFLDTVANIVIITRTTAFARTTAAFLAVASRVVAFCPSIVVT